MNLLPRPLFFLCILSMTQVLFSQTEEELLDQLLLGTNSEIPVIESSAEPLSPFSLSGSAHYDTALSLACGSFEENCFYKNQARIKLKPSYEIDNIRIYADVDYFTNSGGTGESRQTNSLECVEAFVEGSGLFLWKIGKQRFNWGIGDSFQPTNLMDRPDLRDSFMRESDDNYTGVYALSLKYQRGDYALEAAIRPITETILVPAGFYGVNPNAIQSPVGTIEPLAQKSSSKSELADLSGGIRMGGTSGTLDWHLMFYSGMNKEILYRTTLCADASGLTLNLQPELKRMNAFGGDLSFALSKLNIRLEGLYSPDMPALSSISDETMVSAVMQTESGTSSVALQTTGKQPYYNYSGGFDINLWGENGTVFMEWMQARYIDEDGIDPILLSDVLLIRAEDLLFDQALKLSANTLIRTRDKGPGLGIRGEAEYDFKNGLTMSFGTYLFFKGHDNYIEKIKDKDLSYLNIKFVF